VDEVKIKGIEKNSRKRKVLQEKKGDVLKDQQTPLKLKKEKGNLREKKRRKSSGEPMK